MSRTHPGLVKRLFELEVPEIVDGVVELKAIAREPGHRTKIAVASNDNNVDPVGACVGARGSRVRMVVNELRGEKVDIVPYSDDPAEFVMKALAPARVREVRIHDDTGTAEVIVPDFQLSLAIGKEGQNARLAARLTGWRVDIKSETQLAGGGVRRRRRVRRGRVGQERARRARVAAGRGWRDDLGRRGRLRARRRPAPTATADADAAADRRRRADATDGGRATRRRRPTAASRRRRRRRRRRAAEDAATAGRAPRRRGRAADERRRPTRERDPAALRTCVGCRRTRAGPELGAARAGDRTALRVGRAGPGPRRLAVRAAGRDRLLRRRRCGGARSTGRCARPIGDDDATRLRARLEGT